MKRLRGASLWCAGVLAGTLSTAGAALGVSSDHQTWATLARNACVAPAPVFPATPASAPTTASIDDLLQADPAAAFALACQRIATAPQPGADPREAALALVEAHTALARLDAAATLLDAVRQSIEADTAAAPALVGYLRLVQARLANERAEDAIAATLYAAARAALTTVDATHTRRYAAVLVGQAHGWRSLGAVADKARAEAALDEAAALLESLGLAESPDMSDLLIQRTVLAYSRQDLPGAVRWAQADLDIYRRTGRGDSPGKLSSLASLGATLSQLGRFDEAEAALREGLRLIDLHPDAEPSEQLGILNNLVSLHADRGQNDAALAVAERSLALATRVYGEGSARTLTPLTGRAQALLRLSRFAPAKRAFEAALSVATTHAASVGPLRRLRLQDSYAAVLLALGDIEAAQAVIDDALRESGGDANLGYWRGRLLKRNASLAARAGRWADADAQFAEAAPLIGAAIGMRQPFVLDMTAERCVAQLRGKLPGSACGELPAVLADMQVDTREAAPGFRFRVLAAMAMNADASGRAAEARQRHLEALAAAQSAGTPDPQWSAFDALAVHLRGNGEHALAVLMAKQSIEQIEAMRLDLGADQKRYERGFLANKFSVYRRLADWLTEDGRIDEALEILRLLKQEEYFDYVRRDAGEAGALASADLWSASEASLRERWMQFNERDGSNDSDVTSKSGPGAPAAPPESAGAQRRREAERVARWQRFISDNAEPPRLRAAPPAAPDTGHAAPGELQVWAFLTDDHLTLVIDSGARRESVRVAVEPREMARNVGTALSGLSRHEPALDSLQALYRQLGAPLVRAAQRVGAQRIVLRTDGVLRYLPFAALHDGHAYLGERYAIEQRPMAGPAAVTSGATGPASPALGVGLASARTVRALGVTRGMGGMAPLRAVAREVCGIVSGPIAGLTADDGACAAEGRGQGLVRGEAWLNESFTADRLRLAAAETRPGQHDLLHVGTHFVLRPGNMGRSWLLLGDGSRLYVDDISRLSFSGQDLVTLSACETGLGGAGDADSGQEVEGLSAVVMRRGARAVVASLWRVEDESTGILMLALYAELARSNDPAQALFRAQAAVRDAAGGRFADPFYWAGFYVATHAR